MTAIIVLYLIGIEIAWFQLLLWKDIEIPHKGEEEFNLLLCSLLSWLVYVIAFIIWLIHKINKKHDFNS